MLMRVSRALLRFEAIALCAVLQVSCHSSPNQPEKTEAQRIVDAFREKVDADLQAHKGRKDVWPQAQTKYEEAGWYMEADELPSSYSINVEKTESLVSPYLGTAEFPVTGNVSYPKNSREEALEATQFKSSYTINHRLQYAYQNGQWVLKSEKCFDYDIMVEGHAWGNCNVREGHGAHLPVIVATP
jgi:hypothetical protein